MKHMAHKNGPTELPRGDLPQPAGNALEIPSNRQLAMSREAAATTT